MNVRQILFLFGPWAFPATSLAQASFTPLGDLPAGAFHSEAMAVSSDGTTAVGSSIVAGSGLFPLLGAFEWSKGSIRALYPPGGEGSYGTGVSADGQVAVGYILHGSFSPHGTQATVFENGAWTLLGDLEGGASGVPQSFARGVSADGMVVVGIGESKSGPEAFRLARGGAMVGLGDLPGGRFASYAHAVSGDGQTVVGLSFGNQDEQQAIRWTAGGGMQGLGWLPTAPGVIRHSIANAVSADGSVVVGLSRSLESTGGGEACIWVGGGTPVGLGDLPGGNMQSVALAVSADGSMVVGRGLIEGGCTPFGCPGEPRAFVWTAAGGMQDLQQLLESQYGLPPKGWRLREASGISADGSVIVGTGLNPAGAFEAWMVEVPWATCYPDCNFDGTLNLADFGCFQTKFALGDPYADCNEDLVLNLADFGCFQTEFAVGCR